MYELIIKILNSCAKIVKNSVSKKNNYVTFQGFRSKY